jgi:hypothetical protein
MSKLYILNEPETGRSFELKEGVNYLGRSHENEVQSRMKPFPPASENPEKGTPIFD